MSAIPSSRGYVAVVVAALGMTCLGVGDARSEGESFFDDFTKPGATLDNTRWDISDGWSNGDWHNCTWSAKNVQIGVGALNLILTNEPYKERLYSCGEIQTLKFYTYGTYEVRMRTASGSGLISAFFTYTGIGHGKGRPHDEIDFEFVGRRPKTVEANYFANVRGVQGHTAELDFDASQTFNDYAFQWTPDAIRWFVNGRIVHEARPGPGEAFPAASQKLYLSIWTGKGWDQEAWLGRLDPVGVPFIASVEYVAYTKLGESCLFPSSILCSVTDTHSAPK